MEQHMGDPVLSQFRGLYFVAALRSFRDMMRNSGNPRSVWFDTCSQFYIMPCRRHNNSADTKPGYFNVARLRNYVCQSIRILFAHPNTLPRLSTERLRTDLLRIFDHAESQDSSSSVRAMTRRPHLIKRLLCWKAIALPLHLKERL